MQEKKKARRKPKPKQREGINFVTEYTHYRTGKRMIAREYGWEAWPIGKGRS